MLLDNFGGLDAYILEKLIQIYYLADDDEIDNVKLPTLSPYYSH